MLVFDAMHITKDYYNNNSNFDWDAFFSLKGGESIFDKVDKLEILQSIRNNFKENNYQLALALCGVIDELLQNVAIVQPKILELGAATGSLTRFLIDRYNGTGVLVDQSETAYQRFLPYSSHYADSIKYLNMDLFQLNLEEKYDLVCSFGLIEHFKDKKKIIEAHQMHVGLNGYLLILVPSDTILTRVFFNIHPELNLGYRELLSMLELESVLRDSGLQIINTSKSKGYCYDFIGALCKLA